MIRVAAGIHGTAESRLRFSTHFPATIHTLQLRSTSLHTGQTVQAPLHPPTHRTHTTLLPPPPPPTPPQELREQTQALQAQTGQLSAILQSVDERLKRMELAVQLMGDSRHSAGSDAAS